MRTIIAGPRFITDYGLVVAAVDEARAHGIAISAVVSGMARGVDTLALQYAVDHSLPVHKYPAKWDIYGRSAGYRRNLEMADNAEALVALWDGQSKGTGHMIDIARDKGLTVYVKVVS